MKRLPLEMLLIIFEKVEFINIIKLRSVCKYWKSIIDNNKIVKQLSIDETDNPENKVEDVVYLNGFEMDGSRIFKKIFGSSLLSALKYLNYTIIYKSNDMNKLNHLNCFQRLECLNLQIYTKEKEIKIKLFHTNIKCLSLFTSVDEEFNSFKMEINCPECEELNMNCNFDLDNFNVVYREKIKIIKLNVTNYGYILDDYYDGIDKFVNVEHLKIHIRNARLCFVDELSTQISKLSKLKKIEIEFEYSENLCNSTIKRIKKIKKLLYYLIDKISEKYVLIFLQKQQMYSKNQVKDLFNKYIGQLNNSEIHNSSITHSTANYFVEMSIFSDAVSDNIVDAEMSIDTDNEVMLIGSDD